MVGVARAICDKQALGTRRQVGILNAKECNLFVEKLQKLAAMEDALYNFINIRHQRDCESMVDLEHNLNEIKFDRKKIVDLDKMLEENKQSS